jgi:outer membrane lipoprotein
MKAQVIALVGMLLVGCAATPVIPPELKEKVDWTVPFSQIKASPESYRGRVIVVGGMVLSAKPLKDRARIEVLQLPLDGNQEPTGRLTDSQGRFLLFHKEFIDPATIPLGTRLTAVAEVTGSETLKLDEIEYVYPSLEGRSLTIWPPRVPGYWYRPYPYFGAYWGPYWGPPVWGPYFWPPVY